MSKTAHITLGAASFAAHPLTLGEYEDIVDIVEVMGSGTMRERMQAAREVVLTAWRRTDANKTSEDVRALIASPAELIIAAGAILRLSGLEKASASGEAEAG